MADPCDSVIVSQVLNLVTIVKQRITQLFTSHGKLLVNGIKDVYQDISKDALTGAKTWLAADVRDSLIEAMVGAVNTALQIAVGLDFKTARTQIGKYISVTGTYANQLAVLIMGIPNFDLILIKENIIDARKYLFLYTNMIIELESRLLNIKSLLPGGAAEDWTDTIIQKYLPRWINLLEFANSYIFKSEENIKIAKPVYPLISSAERNVNTVSNELINLIPNNISDPVEFLKHTNIYKIIDESQKIIKLVLGDVGDPNERLNVNKHSPWKFYVPPFIDNYEKLIFYLDGIAAFGDLTKSTKERFSLTAQFDKFIVSIALIVSDYISNVIDQMYKTMRGTRFYLAAYYYRWIIILVACDEILKQLLEPTKKVEEHLDLRSQLNIQLNDLRGNLSKLNKNAIISSFLDFSKKLVTIADPDIIRQSIDNILKILSDEIRILSKIAQILNSIDDMLPDSNEFEQAALKTAQQIGEKFGVPAEKFNVRTIQNIYSDVKLAALASAQLVALTKCLIEKMEKAPTVEEKIEMRGALNIARSVSAPAAYSAQQIYTRQLKELETTVSTLQKLITMTKT